MKKCWLLALVAVALVGCAESSDDSCNDGQVSCNGKCVAACTTGTLNPTTCVCDVAAQTCEEQGKVTCNNVCYEKCADNAARDPNNSCACPGQPAPTCEEQGKVTCKGACVDACATGKTLNTETCECEGGDSQTCEEQGKVTCGGVCYEKCDNDGVRDEANGCACPGKTEVTCEEQGKVTCKDSCVDACAAGKTLNTETCECEGGEDNTCQEQGKVACGGACYDPCPTGTSFDMEKCGCVEDVPVDTKCSEPADCKDPSLPVCDTESGECVADTCGNGVVIAPEICDPTVPESFANRTCEDLDSTKDWKEGGKPGCSDLCHLSTGSCVEKDIEIPTSCGDGKLDKNKGEQCEDDDDIPKNVTCASEVNANEYWTADSRVTCNRTTCLYDTTTCIIDLCGNGVVDEGEECDFGRNANGELNTKEDCVKIDSNYTDGKAECTRSCNKLDVTSCMTDLTDRGIYFCQIQDPTSVVFDANKTSEKMSVKYAIGSDVDESQMQSELVWGINFADKDNWQKKSAAQDASNDKFAVDLTRQNVEHYVGADGVYYTFRVRKSANDAWTYCTLTGTGSDINKNTVGSARISSVISGNIISEFNFDDTDKWKGADPRNGGTGFAADKGTGIIKLEPAKSASNWWKCSGSCFSGGVTGQSFGIGGCKTAKSDAINNSGEAVGNHLLISSVNVSGVSNINLDMQVKRNDAASSPKKLSIRYSTNGSDYTEAKEVVLPTEDTNFHAIVPLNLPSAVDNCSALSIQIVPFDGGDKLIKFDNIVISKNNN